MTSPDRAVKRWVAVVDPLEDDGALVDEVFENQPDPYRTVPRAHIRIALETLVRLEYEISYYPERDDDED